MKKKQPRPKQLWRLPNDEPAPKKGAKGAIPYKQPNTPKEITP